MMSNKARGSVPAFFVTRDREFTIAFGIYVDEELGAIPFAGATKKNPKDHENKARGERLAVGNAFRHLGRKLIKAEYDAIHTQFQSPKKRKIEEEACDHNCEVCEDISAYEDSGYNGEEEFLLSDYDVGYEDGYYQAEEDAKVRDQ